MSSEHDIWQPQEPGKAWKGAGLYHITLTIPSREPLLGSLVIPENDPAQARVDYSDLGRAVLDYQIANAAHYPEIQILHYCLMPDHLHAIWYVRKTMPRGIESAVRGFWQGVKKAGRAYSYLSSFTPESDSGAGKKSCSLSSFTPESDSGKLNKLYAIAEHLRGQIPDAAYAALPPVFTEMPFIRPMGQRRQLPTTIRYIDMNPQRLATKRLKPGFFRVQEGIEIAGRTYRGIGNAALLQAERYAPVHVRRTMIDEAMHGDNTRLRNYMNGCVLAARQDAVMVSPFISDKEKEVMVVLLAEEHPIIYIADNGFRDYYKPSDGLFDSVAAGRVLILSPWEYDPTKRHVTRAECVAMNRMAEEICTLSSLNPESDSEEPKKTYSDTLNSGEGGDASHLSSFTPESDSGITPIK